MLVKLFEEISFNLVPLWLQKMGHRDAKSGTNYPKNGIYGFKKWDILRADRNPKSGIWDSKSGTKEKVVSNDFL